MTPQGLLAEALINPGVLVQSDLRGWEQLLILGRRHGLSGRWYEQLKALGLMAAVPGSVQRHLEGDARVARKHARTARWEVRCIERAFMGSDIPVVLLKGAAYVAQGLPCGDSRLIADVDILVPFARIREAESTLHGRGWRSTATNTYDAHYFRDWMHEIPPMQHRLRGSVVDVHHNILPRTCRLCPDPAPLFERAVPLDGGRIHVLDPVDMTIHSILHGFYNGEFTNCLRDVLDIHELATYFGERDGAAFWRKLIDRVNDMGIQRPCYYALSSSAHWFKTTLPGEVADALKRLRPAAPTRLLIGHAINATFTPSVPITFLERLAFRVLHARSHWIKMPPLLLIKHLSYKSWLRLRERLKKPEQIPT